MLDPNMHTRITIAEMHDHSWFTNVPGHMESNIMTEGYFALARGRTLSRLLSAYKVGYY